MQKSVGGYKIILKLTKLNIQNYMGHNKIETTTQNKQVTFMELKCYSEF